MAEDRGWRIESSADSVTADIQQATLALRLGIAVNAMRAAQKFYWKLRDATGPAGERDRLWAFLIAMDTSRKLSKYFVRNFR